LAVCPACAERWESERLLTDQFRVLRVQADALFAEGAIDGARHDALMQAFAVRSRQERRRATVRSWGFALAAAATVVISVAITLFSGAAGRARSHVSVSPVHNPLATQTLVYESSSDASSLSTDDFIAVPYTPPLAQGELVRVVHADLYPGALASMGLDLSSAWARSDGSNVPADVVIGEDGIPRAVRITENAQ
jgi:hypothetical protein